MDQILDLYLFGDRRSKVVEIRKAPSFEAGASRDLFETSMSWESDVMGDGQRLLVNLPVNDTALSPIRIVLNWQEELKQRVPVN